MFGVAWRDKIRHELRTTGVVKGLGGQAGQCVEMVWTCGEWSTVNQYRKQWGQVCTVKGLEWMNCDNRIVNEKGMTVWQVKTQHW